MALLAGGTTLAEPLPPPGGLYNAGDYYLYRDRSSVPLWRSTNEIALRRDKALSQGTALATRLPRMPLRFTRWMMPPRPSRI